MPAYRTLLEEAGVRPAAIRSLQDFGRMPGLDKRTTFQRFAIDLLCLNGQLARLGSG